MSELQNEPANKLLNSKLPEQLLEEAKPFFSLMMQYKCAIREVETKLQVLNEEFSLEYQRNPFETIKSRIKSPMSILEKLQRKGLEISVESIEKNLFDIAGIRVICSFPEDIYSTAQLLINQDDITLIQVKDYIANPKSNGYRSLHLILDVPIFLSQEKKHMKVEVQFRTIAMDFWASLEHKLKYKKDIDNSDSIVEELKKCADVITQMDYRMQEIRNTIENGDVPHTLKGKSSISSPAAAIPSSDPTPAVRNRSGSAPAAVPVEKPYTLC